MDHHEKYAIAKRFAREYLAQCSADLVELSDTAVLPQGKMRELIHLCSFSAPNAMAVATEMVTHLALEVALGAKKEEAMVRATGNVGEPALGAKPQTFEEWWQEHWKSKDTLPVLQGAFKEIGQAAWNAAFSNYSSARAPQLEAQCPTKTPRPTA